MKCTIGKNITRILVARLYRSKQVDLSTFLTFFSYSTLTPSDMEKIGSGKVPQINPGSSAVPDNSEQQHLLHVDKEHVDKEAEIPQNISETRDNTHSKVNHEMESRNDSSGEDPVDSDPQAINIGDIKEAWTDDSFGQNDQNAEANHKSGIELVGTLLSGIEAETTKTAEEERIRELLAYMEGEKRRQEAECRELKGTHSIFLLDIGFHNRQLCVSMFTSIVRARD